MNFWHSVGGMITLEVTGADIPRTISLIQNADIAIYNTVRPDELTIQFQVKRSDYINAAEIINKRGDILKCIGKKGVFWTGKRLLKRRILLSGLLFIFAVSLFLPTRIYFIRVEGNETIPSKQILEQAELCGIAFGASRREVRSEKLKNALLEVMPQLKWAGINTSGCTAVISVREREQSEPRHPTIGVSSMVADRDGVILSCTVTKGNPLCKVGQAVKAGQVLISGYTDCGLSIRASTAQGEIFARTEREIMVVSAANYRKRTGIIKTEKKYSLLIGKKQINFYKDSGISDTTCDKMYVEEKLVLPGGFELPVSLITEVWTYYEVADTVMNEDEIEFQMADFASDYLQEQMIAGEILTADETLSFSGEVYSLQGRYACREMICRVQKEGIITPNGKHD